MNVLLVIDMQNAWLNGATPRFERWEVIERINHAAEHMRRSGGKVIFVRHCDAESEPGSNGWEIEPNLVQAAADSFIDKTACDTFADTPLLSQLESCGANTLFVCGLATEFCVDTTIRAAVSHGYDVVALSDAHTTGDRPHLSAESIIAHHNWVWANMQAPQGRRLQVKTVGEVFF